MSTAASHAELARALAKDVAEFAGFAPSSVQHEKLYRYFFNVLRNGSLREAAKVLTK